MRTPSFHHACCLWFFCLALTPGLPAQQMSPSLYKTWNTYFSDVGGNEEARARAEQELATSPEFKTEALEMLRRDYFEARQNGQRGDTQGVVLLSLREDLTAEEQKQITDELAKHVREDDHDANSFVFPALNLLAHYPSPEHEALVLHFLNRSAREDQVLMAAFKTLSKIGGEKSLAPMNEVAARMKRENGKYPFLENMDRHLSIVQHRVENKTSGK